MSAVQAEKPAFHVVKPSEIDALWPHIVVGVEKALQTSNGEATAEDTKEGLKAGRTTLLLFSSEAGWVGIVYMFLAFPRFKIARVLLAFGRHMATMAAEIEVAEAWAKDQGCKYVEAWVATESRARLFARLGYAERPYTIIRKRLT